MAPVTAPPVIITQPANLTVALGRTATFQVAADGVPPPTYQWRFNETDLGGATLPTLTLPNVQLTNAGNYTVVGSNSEGVATSQVAVLTVTPAPTNPGAVDVEFYPGSGADGAVNVVALDGDGTILIGGQFSSVDGLSRGALARLRSDGRPDTNFNASIPSGLVDFLALGQEEKIVIGGTFASVGGLPRNRIARLSSDGTLDTMFVPQAQFSGQNGSVLGVQTGGKVVWWWGGVSTFRISRLNRDGSSDLSFTDYFLPFPEGSSGHPPPIALAGLVQPDEKLLAGDYFMMRLHPNGLVDEGFFFNWQFNGHIFAVARQPDGRLLLGGSFTMAQSLGNPVSLGRVVRFNLDWSVDTTFNPGVGADGNVNAIALQSDGKIILGGLFTTVGGTPRGRLARLYPDGSLDESFDSSAGADGAVNALALDREGGLIVGGSFTSIDGVPRRGIARVRGDSPAAPVIVSPPSDQTTTEGQSVSLLVAARCVPAGSFQWRFNGADLEGATNQLLRLHNVRAADAGATP